MKFLEKLSKQLEDAMWENKKTSMAIYALAFLWSVLRLLGVGGEPNIGQLIGILVALFASLIGFFVLAKGKSEDEKK